MCNEVETQNHVISKFPTILQFLNLGGQISYERGAIMKGPVPCCRKSVKKQEDAIHFKYLSLHPVPFLLHSLPINTPHTFSFCSLGPEGYLLNLLQFHFLYCLARFKIMESLRNLPMVVILKNSKVGCTISTISGVSYKQ